MENREVLPLWQRYPEMTPKSIALPMARDLEY
jgi:hypothetical protein